MSDSGAPVVLGLFAAIGLTSAAAARENAAW